MMWTNRTPLACLVVFLAGVGLPSLGARIECTQAAFEQALRDACPGGDVTITFDCRDTTILIDENSDRYERVISCGDVVIDGEDRNITFRQDPACNAEYPDSCPDVERGAWLLSMEGNRGILRNVTVDSFWEGVHAGDGEGNLVENVTFLTPCDDAFTNREGAVGTVIRDSTIRSACDKAIQAYGRGIGSTDHLSPDDPTYYDLEVRDNDFVDCKQPVRTTQKGRFLVQGNRFRVEDSQGGLYRCDGPRFSGDKIAVYFIGNRVDSCRRGLRANENVEIFAEDNLFVGNDLRGALVSGGAVGLFQGNRFEGNGGGTSEEAFYGGLAVAQTAVVDAGNGSVTLDNQSRTSEGGNVFLGNRGPEDSTLDLSNQSSTSVKAESCYWGTTEPAGHVAGDVDFDPWLADDPGSGDAPLPYPDNVRRTDKQDEGS